MAVHFCSEFLNVRAVSAASDERIRKSSEETICPEPGIHASAGVMNPLEEPAAENLHGRADGCRPFEQRALMPPCGAVITISASSLSNTRIGHCSRPSGPSAPHSGVVRSKQYPGPFGVRCVLLSRGETTSVSSYASIRNR
jgi:hypothetical protein